MTFGKRLRELRAERGLNQGHCADLFNLSSSAIGAYERNEREPAYSHLVEFADYFRVSIDYLMCRTDERLMVDDYIKRKSFDLAEILSTHEITIKGYKLTEEDKKNLSDVSIGLFWKKFS